MAKKLTKADTTGLASAALSGADFIVVRGELKSKVATGNPERPFTLVLVAREGETCERVNPESLGWLLEQGYIRRREIVPAAGDTDGEI